MVIAPLGAGINPAGGGGAGMEDPGFGGAGGGALYVVEPGNGGGGGAGLVDVDAEASVLFAEFEDAFATPL